MKSKIEKDDTEIYLTHNEAKSIATKRFIRKLKSKICKCVYCVY